MRLRFTHPWVGQAERLACRKRQPGAFVGAACTHYVERRTNRKATVAAVWALCAGLRAGVEAGAPVEGISAVLGCMWAASA